MTPNSIEAANRTLTHLEAKKLEAEQRIAGLAQERAAVSFDALAGDAKAQKRLAALNVEASAAQRDLENICSAIAEARRRVEAAERDAAMAAERAKAGAVMGHADEIERLAREADEHAKKFRAALTALLDHSHEISISGYRGVAPFRTIQLALGRATLAVLAGMQLGLDVRVLAPGERRSFTDTVRTLVASARGMATAVLGETTPPPTPAVLERPQGATASDGAPAPA